MKYFISPGLFTPFFFFAPSKMVTFVFFVLPYFCFGGPGTIDTLKAQGHGHPVYPPAPIDREKLMESVKPLMGMSLEEIIAEVPDASGIFFVGCPHCNGGAQEMNVLGWKPGMGDEVRCNYCGMGFPNEQFPNNREKVIIAPSGARQVYRYHEDQDGRQFFFEAHAWYERWIWIRRMAAQLSQLWYVTQDNAYGDRAAAIIGRFAQLYPDYPIRYDYPHAPVKFFPADQKWPFEGLVPYRGAKWSWWGYYDIPATLTAVYDLLQSGYDWKRMDAVIGLNTDSIIEKDLLRLGYQVTTANPETYTNVSPSMYSSMIKAGRVLGDPSMVHEAVDRFRSFFSRGFFADGWWKEGTVSYHDMTIRGLQNVADALKGYTDPPEWKGERFMDLDLSEEMPLYKKALEVSRQAVMPNGRKIPINDTWPYNKGTSMQQSFSRLWPSLGNAALGSGEGDQQIMVNLNWSGNYGHAHYDNGSIILFASGEELLSDIGYTHTRYRGWTMHTASHNTVVLDTKAQEVGTMDKPVTGNLNFYDDSHPHVKAIDVDASPAYADASTYRRRLVMVNAGPGRDYVVDRFDVQGGNDHDWFLHGMIEEEGSLETSPPLDRSVETLVPPWGGFAMPKNQYDTDMEGRRSHAYVFLKDIKTGTGAKHWTATWKYENSGLRTHMFSPKGTKLFRFKSPSVRPALEDENKLDDYMRNGLLQRHSGGQSTFLAVHEPFGTEHWIDSVQYENGVLKIKYTLDGRPVEDRVEIRDVEMWVGSSHGWSYHSGKPLSGEVIAMDREGAGCRLLLDRPVPQVDYIRMDLHGGSTLYYPVKSIKGNWVELKEDPGFSFTDGMLKFHTFPGNEISGPLKFTVFERQSVNTVF